MKSTECLDAPVVIFIVLISQYTPPNDLLYMRTLFQRKGGGNTGLIFRVAATTMTLKMNTVCKE